MAAQPTNKRDAVMGSGTEIVVLKSRCASILTLPNEKISAVDVQVAVGVALAGVLPCR